MVTPILAAAASLAALILILVLAFKRNRAIAIAAQSSAAAACLLSVMHAIIFGARHCTLAGIFITMLLEAATFVLVPSVKCDMYKTNLSN
jgi:hypothetical protein